MLRLLLAATLGASYGIYGPAFELGENAPREPGSEEYLNSEKYELKNWDLESPQSIRHFIARVNQIRRENPALQRDHSLKFHETDNPYLICYSKTSEDLSNIIIVVVNLDWAHTQSGWVTLDCTVARAGLNPPVRSRGSVERRAFLVAGPAGLCRAGSGKPPGPHPASPPMAENGERL